LLKTPSEPVIADVDPKGKLLFEDAYEYKSNRVAYILIGSLAIFLGVIFLTLVISSNGWKLATFFDVLDFDIFIGMLFISMVFGLFLFYMSTKYHKFRIFENGISFTVPLNNPFLSFDDIDFITKADYERITIYRKSPNDSHLTVSSAESRQSANDHVRDWSRFVETLETRLMQTHQDRIEINLIRDYKNVGWAREALKALEDRLRWGLDSSAVARWTNERVLKEGRYKVELSDIQEFLK
jgi:hypothetical protein